jgi:hypothetical protein
VPADRRFERANPRAAVDCHATILAADPPSDVVRHADIDCGFSRNA